MVDKWLVRQHSIPEYVRNYIFRQYGIRKKLLEEPIEEIDDRPIGEHAKILYRTGYCAHKNYDYYDVSIKFADFIWRNRTKDPEKVSKILCSLPEKERELALDSWFYIPDNNCWENDRFPKKKNLLNMQCGSWLYKGSLKSVIRQLLRQGFPIGTFILIESFNYEGEIGLLIKK